MATITLTPEDIMRVEAIELDRDGEEALKFIRERILPEIRRLKSMKLQSHLDSGRESPL